MTTYQFTLIVEGPDLQDGAHLDALFIAGCDDATVGRVGPIQYLDFDREAASLAGAVFEAMEAVEAAVPEARVVHVEPDELVTLSEIAERTGRTRESVRLLVGGERGPGEFPAAATHFKSRRRMWRWQEVSAWFARTPGSVHAAEGLEAARFLTAFNAALRLRALDDQLSPDDRRRVRKLAG